MCFQILCRGSHDCRHCYGLLACLYSGGTECMMHSMTPRVTRSLLARPDYGLLPVVHHTECGFTGCKKGAHKVTARLVFRQRGTAHHMKTMLPAIRRICSCIARKSRHSGIWSSVFRRPPTRKATMVHMVWITHSDGEVAVCNVSQSALCVRGCVVHLMLRRWCRQAVEVLQC